MFGPPCRPKIAGDGSQEECRGIAGPSGRCSLRARTGYPRLHVRALADHVQRYGLGVWAGA
jgi:hypothetical protein